MTTLSDSASDVLWVRAWVGDDPDDARLDEIFDDPEIGGSRGNVALWVLQNRKANLLSNPTSFSIPEVYSETTTSAEILKLLNSQIAALVAAIGPLGDEYAFDDDLGVLERSDYSSRR